MSGTRLIHVGGGPTAADGQLGEGGGKGKKGQEGGEWTKGGEE